MKLPSGFASYDEQIEYLTAHPEEIGDQWNLSCDKGLFKFVGQGCLTQIKDRRLLGKDMVIQIKGIPDEELTRELMKDDRIPISKYSITVKSLPAFKEWQERIDALQQV